MTSRTLKLGLLLACAASCGARAASAESAGRQAAAEALFQQATALVDAGKLSEACEKFAASQELDPGLGTLLHLADCYDRVGRTASAWALFRDVQERAARASQTDREHIARERADALESKLSRLELRVRPNLRPAGLELTLAGAPVPQASWNVALPVDPGIVRVEARAPGRKPWSTQVELRPDGGTQALEVPELALAPKPRAEASAPVEPQTEASSWRTLGWVSGGLGLVAVAAGGFFGYRAYSLNQDSKSECRTSMPNACTSHGATLREQAQSAARVANITTISGAVLVTAGVTLILAAPSPGRPAREAAFADPPQLGLALGGVW